MIAICITASVAEGRFSRQFVLCKAFGPAESIKTPARGFTPRVALKRVLLLLLFLPLLANGQAPFLGYWQGAAIRDGSVRVFDLQVVKAVGKTWAIVHSPDWGWADPQEIEAQVTGTSLTFRIGGLPVTLLEDPERGEAVGTLGEGPQAIRLHFKRALSPAPTPVLKSEVTFKSREATIAGTLIKPITNRAVPAVVFLPGRGASERQGYRMAERFAERGIAMLIFDQRGTGKSTGDAKSSTIQDQIQDGASAVRFLMGRKDINPSKIGLYTESAGGWVGPFVATSPAVKVSFLMVSVCPAESVEQQQLSTFELYLRHSPKHLSEDEVQKGIAFVRLMLDHSIRKAERKALDESFAEMSKARYADEIEATPAGLADNVDWIRRHNIDPAPAWRKIKAPVLAVYGGVDDIVESTRNTALLRKYLEEAGNKDVTILTIPNAGHGLRVNGGARSVGDQRYYSWTRMPPSVPETFLDWCALRVQ